MRLNESSVTYHWLPNEPEHPSPALFTPARNPSEPSASDAGW